MRDSKNLLTRWNPIVILPPLSFRTEPCGSGLRYEPGHDNRLRTTIESGREGGEAYVLSPLVPHCAEGGRRAPVETTSTGQRGRPLPRIMEVGLCFSPPPSGRCARGCSVGNSSSDHDAREGQACAIPEVGERGIVRRDPRPVLPIVPGAQRKQRGNVPSKNAQRRGGQGLE